MKHYNKIAKKRKESKMTQAQLAEKAKISVTQLQNIEYGNSAPNVYLAKRISQVLGTTVEEIFTTN